MTKVEAGRLSAVTASGYAGRRRAVWLWVAAVLLVFGQLPFLPLLRRMLEIWLRSAGSDEGQIARNLAGSVSIFLGTLGVCSYLAGNRSWKPMRALRRWLIAAVSMALLASGYLAYNFVDYLRALSAP